VDHHLKRLGEGNLDGLVFDYASTAVLFMPDGRLSTVIRGLGPRHGGTRAAFMAPDCVTQLD
jgi:hypothetical protein